MTTFAQNNSGYVYQVRGGNYQARITPELQKLPISHEVQIAVAKIREDLIKLSDIKSATGKNLIFVALDVYYKIQNQTVNPNSLGAMLQLEPHQVKRALQRYSEVCRNYFLQIGRPDLALGNVSAISMIHYVCQTCGLTQEVTAQILNYWSSRQNHAVHQLIEKYPPQIGATAMMVHFFYSQGYEVNLQVIQTSLLLTEVNSLKNLMVQLQSLEP